LKPPPRRIKSANAAGITATTSAVTTPHIPAFAGVASATCTVKARRASMPDQGRNALVWLWLSLLVLVLDQITKLAVIDRMTAYVDVIAITGFFNLVHVHNTGAAFSLFADQPGWQRGFFVGVAAIASVVILYLLRKTQGRRLFSIALALILGGAIGNVIDRILYGHVIDFLDVHAGGWHWPAFNVADAAITVGAAMLIWDGMRSPKIDETV
jgi:signal peptidase II